MREGMADWERELLSAAEDRQRERDQQRIINKYDDALKALDNYPMAIVESTYRGLLGEFYREMRATENA